jgi:hypothetical protein
MEDLFKKERVGDGLTDQELHRLLDFYKPLEKDMMQLGSEFALATREISRRIRNLDSMVFWRKNL